MRDNNARLFESMVNGIRHILNGGVFWRISDCIDGLYINKILNLVSCANYYTVYEKAPNVLKLGIPYYDACKSDKSEEEYWVYSHSRNNMLRKVIYPLQSPVDILRVGLDDHWPQGIRLLRDTSGRCAFSGLVRVFKNGASSQPHVDRVEWNAPAHRLPFNPIAQIAINLYVSMPDLGGEVQIWNYMLSRDEQTALRVSGGYSIDVETLGYPLFTFKPGIGELLLFDARKVHSVLPSFQGERVAISTFLIFSEDLRGFLFS